VGSHDEYRDSFEAAIPIIMVSLVWDRKCGWEKREKMGKRWEI